MVVGCGRLLGVQLGNMEALNFSCRVIPECAWGLKSAVCKDIQQHNCLAFSCDDLFSTEFVKVWMVQCVDSI